MADQPIPPAHDPDDADEHAPRNKRDDRRTDDDTRQRGDPPVNEKERRTVTPTADSDNRAGLPRDDAQPRVDEPSHRHGRIVAGPDSRRAGQPTPADGHDHDPVDENE